MSNKLYVGNVPFLISEIELSQLFSSCGTIIDIIVPTDKISGKPRGFVFIEMSSKEETNKAISELNNVIVGGRTIKVDYASDKPDYKPNRPYAKEMGIDICIVCKSKDFLYGFDDVILGGICTSCISSLSKASRPHNKKHD